VSRFGRMWHSLQIKDNLMQLIMGNNLAGKLEGDAVQGLICRSSPSHFISYILDLVSLHHHL